MKLHELFLPESVTFSVAKLIKDDPKYPKGIFSSAEFEKEGEEECWTCDGTGHEEYGGKKYKCGHCNGTTKLKTWERPFDELNVSNGNAADILEVIGLDREDYSGGHIDHADLPAFRRKIIKLMNTDHGLEKPGEVEHGKMRKTRDEHGNAMIGRGPTIIHGGRTSEQVGRYFDKLLKLIDFAQKNNAALVWA